MFLYISQNNIALFVVMQGCKRAWKGEGAEANVVWGA